MSTVRSDPVVSCATLTFYIDYLRERSVPSTGFLLGLRYTPAFLQRRFNFIDYETLLEIEGRFEALFPDEPDIHFKFGRSFCHKGLGGWIGVMFRSVFSPGAAYRGIPRVAGLLFPFVTVEVKQTSENAVTLYYRFKDGYPPSERFLETVRGILTSAPVVAGYPESTVVWRWMTRQEAIFDVQIARIADRGLARIRRGAGRILRVTWMQAANFGHAIDQLEETNRFLHQSVNRLSEAKRDLQLTNTRLESEIAERQRGELRRRELEAQLHQTAKLEAIGRLAGGVAHDMNNILGGIMGYATLLSTEHGERIDDQEVQTRILAGCRRGRDLTDGLLNFARSERRPKASLSPGALIRESLALIGPNLDKSICVEIDVAEDVDPVVGDRVQLAQALIHLVVNGSDAMPDGGTLTLTARNVSWPAPATEGGPGIRPSRHVLLEVADSGVGMDADTVSRVHEPFFTTKREGDGTGLGLSMTYGAIRDHGGSIEIDSAPGRGTTMRILLPSGTSTEPEGRHKLTHDSEPARHLHRNSPGRARGPALTVMLVDDERDLRESGELLLQSMGFEVLTVADGAEAVDLYRRLQSTISVVLLDIRMPVLDGVSAFRQIRALDPTAVILIMSGYASDDTVQDLLAEGAHGFLPKPFDLVEMSRALSEVLEAS